MILDTTSSVIAFPGPSQQASKPEISVADVEDAIASAPKDVRAKWLHHHTGENLSERTRLIHTALVDHELSDNAFRVLMLQQSFGDGTAASVFPANVTICAISGKSARSVDRANKELEKAGWVKVKLRKRQTAIRTMEIPERMLRLIAVEVMENSRTARSDGSCQKFSITEAQEPSDLTVQEVKNRQNEQPRTVRSDGSRGEIFHNEGSRTARSGALPITKEKKQERSKGDIQNSEYARGAVSETPPPRDLVLGQAGRIAATAAAVASGMVGLPAAAMTPPPAPAAVEAPAPVQSYWTHPKAQMAAFANHHEALAQKQLRLTPDGRLEVEDPFRQELLATFPLVELTAGLAAAAPNIQPDRGAIVAMQIVRRQFGYMQQDASRKEKNFDKAVQLRNGQVKKSNKVEELPGVFFNA